MPLPLHWSGHGSVAEQLSPPKPVSQKHLEWRQTPWPEHAPTHSCTAPQSSPS